MINEYPRNDSSEFDPCHLEPAMQASKPQKPESKKRKIHEAGTNHKARKVTRAAGIKRTVKKAKVSLTAQRNFIINNLEFSKLMKIAGADVVDDLKILTVKAVFEREFVQSTRDMLALADCIANNEFLLYKMNRIPRLVSQLKKYMKKLTPIWFEESTLEPIVTCKQLFLEQEHAKRVTREQNRADLQGDFIDQISNFNVATFEVPVAKSCDLEPHEKTKVVTVHRKDVNERLKIKRLIGKIEHVGANNVKVSFTNHVEPYKLKIKNGYFHTNANVFLMTGKPGVSSCTFNLSLDAKRLNIKGFNVPFSAYHTEQEIEFVRLLCSGLIDACATIVIEYFNGPPAQKDVFKWIQTHRMNDTKINYDDNVCV